MSRSRLGPVPNPTGRIRALASLAVALALVAPTASAAPGKRKPEAGLARSQAFVAEGDEALERGDYEDAIAKYSAAYYGLETEERASYMGSIPVRKAMRAYDLLVAQKQDRAVLDRQLGMVTEFLESVKSRPDGVERVGEEVVRDLEAVRSAVEKKIAALADASAPHATDTPKPEPKAEPEPKESETTPPPADPPPEPTVRPSSTPSDQPQISSRSALGIGLAVGGGVVLGTGAGVMAGWWTVRNQAIEFADAEPGYEEGTAERDAYLAREEGRARKYLISGAVLVGVGAAAATTGVVLIALHKRRGKETALTFTPSFDARHAGVVIAGRF